MLTIAFLVIFPLIAAALLTFGGGAYRKAVVYGSTLLIIIASIVMTISFFGGNGSTFSMLHGEVINHVMLGVEVLICAYIVYICIKWKKYFAMILSLLQTGFMVWLELFKPGGLPSSNQIFIDKFSILMTLVIGVVGGLICVFSVGYMKGYHHHHEEFKDRSRMFFPALFVFLAAMFGLVFSNNLIWMYFFWEITTLCSFLLIGYTKTEEAKNNSYRAIWMNLLGGVGFCAAIIYCVIMFGVIDLSELLKIGSQVGGWITLPVMCLSFAALTKSAQLPFSKWLLGAMVAPTPTSALLHSATMVKAGVYLLLRLSPLLHGDISGIMVAFIGGLSFMIASSIAISQNDAKKVLAYSTIANLGLIVACAGIGTSEAIWAGLLLIIFHAVSKSLMFLTVGSVENSTGSRDIEDMHGLIVKMPELAFVMVVGIAGMFLAPFGMLISKWAALKAFVDSGNILLVMMLVFGSAATLFYWTKWLGKLVAVLHHSERLPNTVKGDQWFSLITHAFIMIGLFLTFPLVSSHLIVPYLYQIFGTTQGNVIGTANMTIMVIMLIMIAILPFALRALSFDKKTKMVTTYMAGINTGDNRNFTDSMGNAHPMYLSNWYMDKFFSEKTLLRTNILIATGIILFAFAVVIGGMI